MTEGWPPFVVRNDDGYYLNKDWNWTPDRNLKDTLYFGDVECARFVAIQRGGWVWDIWSEEYVA